MSVGITMLRAEKLPMMLAVQERWSFPESVCWAVVVVVLLVVKVWKRSSERSSDSDYQLFEVEETRRGRRVG